MSSTMNGLLPDHIADLKRSGLSDDTILKMEVSSIGPDELDSRFKMGGVQSALRFEYLQLNGFSPFHRLRFYPPLSKSDSKVQKYWQPGDTGCRLYVPEPVVEIFRDKNAPLDLTEGEKKAWAGVQNGLPTVAIGGIYNFNHKQTDWLLPELDEVLKPGRIITYIPDSDVWIDRRKLESVFRLGTKIGLRGAIFYCVQLPCGPGGKTWGLDDFLLGNTVKDLEKLPRLTLKHEAFAPFKKQQAVITKKRFEEEQAAEAAVAVKPAEINDADRAEALALLQNPNLLKKFLDDIQVVGCVGEADNKVTLFLAYTSRSSDIPLTST